LASTVRPVRVVVAAIVCTMTSWLVSGLPRQFIEMCENSLCSIMFHLLVPGGAVEPNHRGRLLAAVAKALADRDVADCQRQGDHHLLWHAA
jgi:hypothetical protein